MLYTLHRNYHSSINIECIITVKVVIGMIFSISERPIRRDVIHVIMYVETFKIDVTVFIVINNMCFKSNWWIIVSIRVSTLILTMSLDDVKDNVQITENLAYV